LDYEHETAFETQFASKSNTYYLKQTKYSSKVWGRQDFYLFIYFFKEISYAHKGCIYLMKNYSKTVWLFQILMFFFFLIKLATFMCW